MTVRYGSEDQCTLYDMGMNDNASNGHTRDAIKSNVKAKYRLKKGSMNIKLEGKRAGFILRY